MQKLRKLLSAMHSNDDTKSAYGYIIGSLVVVWVLTVWTIKCTSTKDGELADIPPGVQALLFACGGMGAVTTISGAAQGVARRYFPPTPQNSTKATGRTAGAPEGQDDDSGSARPM